MRENRPSGSEGGVAMSHPYPYRWLVGGNIISELSAIRLLFGASYGGCASCGTHACGMSASVMLQCQAGASPAHRRSQPV
jgi:hypothetical protein